MTNAGENRKDVTGFDNSHDDDGTPQRTAHASPHERELSDMPYQPPHLRDAGGDGGSGNESNGGRDSRGPDRYDDRRGGGGGRFDDRRGGDRYDDRRGGGGYDDRRGGGGYDDRRRDDRGGYDDRRRDDRDRDGGSRSGGGGSRGGVPPATFAKWKPSERIQALSVNQVP
jgi:hypothetical protein